MAHKEMVSKEKLPYALIGCGRVSVKHIKAYCKNSDDLYLAAIVDSNPEAPKKLLKEVGFSDKKMDIFLKDVKLYSDYTEMLREIRPKITAVTTPSGLHYRMGVDVMQSGSHLILEKPMTMSSSQAKDLCRISHETGCKIAMGHIYRYFPVVGLIREDIRKGIFGKISHGSVVVRWGHDQKYYDSAPWRGTWKSDGGVLMNQSIHALDLMTWLMDSTAIGADCRIARRFHDMEAEDVGLGILQLENGTLCQIEGTTNTPSSNHEASFHITGSDGTVSLGLRKGKPFFHIRDQKGKSLKWSYFRRELKQSGFAAIPGFFNPHIGIYQDLIAAIREDRQPIADAESGYRSVDMLLGLYQSAKTGHHTNLPLTENFSAEDMVGTFH